VREVASSASLVRLRTLAGVCSAFQPAYFSRLTAQQSALPQAGPELPSPHMLRGLLALLHRQMTRHPRLYGRSPCAHCGCLRDAHVRDIRGLWRLRCPSNHEALCLSYAFENRVLAQPSFYEPEIRRRIMHDLAFTLKFKGKLDLQDAGWLVDDDPDCPASYLLLWWQTCKTFQGFPPKRLSTMESVARALLEPPLVVRIADALSIPKFSRGLLTVTLTGYGSWRRVVVKTNVLGQRAILGFVLSVARNAEGMQDEAWLELEVCLGACTPDDVRLPDVILLMLPLCEQLVLGGPDGMRWVHTSPIHAADKGFLFKSLTLTGLDWANLAGVSDLPLRRRSRRVTEWVGMWAATAMALGNAVSRGLAAFLGQTIYHTATLGHPLSRTLLGFLIQVLDGVVPQGLVAGRYWLDCRCMRCA
jgi:hypothetical protein